MSKPHIPDYWSPEQALAVYEFIDEIREAIWHQYNPRLIELMQEDRISYSEIDDDEISF